MEVLREISSSCDITDGRKLPTGVQSAEKGGPPRSDIRIYSATTAPNEELSSSISEPLSQEGLLTAIKNDNLFRKNTKSSKNASLDLVFLSKDDWGTINKNKSNVVDMCNYLHIDRALAYYIVSHRAGWFFAPNTDGGYSFVIKDYLYILMWSFHPKTLETRAMLASRSHYSGYSSLKALDGKFGIPGLHKAHLYHPLSLACVGLVDAVFYFDFVVIDGSVRTGNIEETTGHGFWHRVLKQHIHVGEDKSKTKPEDQTNVLVDAQRDIVALIGELANLWKSVGIAKSITETLDDLDTWEISFNNANDDATCQKYHREGRRSLKKAVDLLKLRVKTIEQSGKAIGDRAAAQSGIVSTLLVRVDNEINYKVAVANATIAEATMKDSKDMKAVAIMTMAFLPATFMAALFAVPSLQWTGSKVIQDDFWIYWAFTIPTTMLVFLIWDFFNNMNMFKALLARLKPGKSVADEEMGFKNSTSEPDAEAHQKCP